MKRHQHEKQKKSRRSNENSIGGSKSLCEKMESITLKEDGQPLRNPGADRDRIRHDCSGKAHHFPSVPVDCLKTSSDSRKEITYDETIDPEMFPIRIQGNCSFEIDNEEEIVTKTDVIPTQEIIGVVGCGYMAKALISYLVEAKHKVHVYNRTQEKLKELPPTITIESSPASLVHSCDIVLACVSDASAVRNIMEGPNGILRGLADNPKKGYVEMSSLDPNMILKYAEKVTVRGGSYLTAQMGRTRPAAYLGCSWITASGDLDLYERCRSCFSCFSSGVVYLSSNYEEAAIVNITNSAAEFVSLVFLTDSMLAVDKMNLPKPTTVEGLNMGPYGTTLLRAVVKNIVENCRLVFVPLKHILKILRMALNLKSDALPGDVYMVKAIQACQEVVNRYPNALEHDASCLYTLRQP